MDRLNARQNGNPVKVVDCFKYLLSQVAANGGCELDLVLRDTKNAATKMCAEQLRGGYKCEAVTVRAEL